jgi:hypothetical protein
MKFKLLYDDWIRTHPLKRRNQPVINFFHGYQNIIEDESSDEDDHINLFDFSNTFSPYLKERQQLHGSV